MPHVAEGIAAKNPLTGNPKSGKDKSLKTRSGGHTVTMAFFICGNRIFAHKMPVLVRAGMVFWP